MNSFVERIEEKITDFWLKARDTNQKTVVSIGLAVTISVFSGYVYRKLSIPPKKYRALPRITYIDLLKSVIKGETTYEQKKRLILPLLNQNNGIYLQPTHLGWLIRSANPAINKAFLSDIELFPKAENMFGTGRTLVARFIGGKNVGTLEGDNWKRHRKICNPAFHRALPIQLFGHLTQRTFNLLEEIGLENTSAISICERMTLDAIGLAGFGFDFECTVNEKNNWVEDYETIKQNMTKLFFLLFAVFDEELKWMFSSRVNAHKKLDNLLNEIDNMITEKRKSVLNEMNSSEYQHKPDSEKDLLTLMIEAEYAGEGKLSNTELKDNITGFFFAGNDTTAVSLAFAIGQLARNQDIQTKAREEIISILGNESIDVLPTIEDTKQMKYLDAIIKETLRLNTPISNTLPRVASRDVEIDGVFIPKGAYIDVDIIATHLSPKNWENPYEFNPQRYLDDNDATSTKEGLLWTPFGYGAHHCIGSNFSLYEQRVFLSMLLRKFELELPIDSLHKDGLIAEGIGGVRPVDLRINFKKRY